MMELGGEEARRRLFARINSNRMAASGNSNGADDVAAAQDFNAEEAKVQEYGDIGQGERLAGAKRAA